MNKLYIRRLILCLSLVTCNLSLVFGCGYTIHGKANLPFNSVTVGDIVNRTFEPRLEDKMRLALVDNLMKNGFAIDSNSGYRISGIINIFELRALSAKQGLTVEYEVIIKGDFKLTEPSGKTKVLRNSGVFIVSFLSKDSIQSVMAMKEKAIERALSDFSAEITASIIYQ